MAGSTKRPMPDDLPIVAFEDAAAFDAWLEAQKAAMQASRAPAAKVAEVTSTDERTALRVANAE